MPTQPNKPAVYEHQILVRVLTTAPRLQMLLGDVWDLRDIHELITEGDAVGGFKQECHFPLTADEVKRELERLGEDPEFFYQGHFHHRVAPGLDVSV